MRTLRYMVLAVLFLLVVTVIIGFFLPSSVNLQRSTVINRDHQTVFQVVNSLANFNKWSPWYKLDPNAEYVLSGPNSGKGSKITWKGNNNVGEGSHEIIDSQPHESVKTTFYFGKPDHPVYSSVLVKPLDDGNTQVTWTFENDFGYNVFYRYFSLVLEESIAPVYEEGLANLKKYVESLPLHDYSILSVTDTTAQASYAYASETTHAQQDISSAIAAAYGKLMAFINNNKLEMNGSPKITSLSFQKDVYRFLAVIPVKDNTLLDEAGEIQSHFTYEGRTIKAIHKGAYHDFEKTYEIIDAYIQQNNMQKNGNPWEDFVTDPGNVSEEDLITHVYQPIK